MMPWRYGPDGGVWIAWILGSLFWIVILALLVILLVRLWRGGGGGGMWYRGPDAPDSAQEILHRRLASGDIDVEEYERRMTALRAQRPPGR
jgi:putative membrane protein